MSSAMRHNHPRYSLSSRDLPLCPYHALVTCPANPYHLTPAQNTSLFTRTPTHPFIRLHTSQQFQTSLSKIHYAHDPKSKKCSGGGDESYINAARTVFLALTTILLEVTTTPILLTRETTVPKFQIFVALHCPQPNRYCFISDKTTKTASFLK